MTAATPFPTAMPVVRKLSATVADAKRRAAFKWGRDHDAGFPECDPRMEPYGSRVLVQVRVPKRRTASGLIIIDEGRDTEKWNTQAGLIRAIGPLAFCNRETQRPWTEGYWAEPGEFVRHPKYGGDRYEIKMDDDDVLFCIFNDLDLIGRWKGDPLSMVAYI